MTRTAVVRTDGLGDLVLAGPAIRAVAARSRVTVVCGPAGEPVAARLPGVTDVAVVRLPWIDAQPAPVTGSWFEELVRRLAALGADDALVLTSFHQDPLPTALALRLAGVPRIGAISVDYPGSLLDVRHHVDDDRHEVERACSLATAMGYPLPAGDDGRLAVDAWPATLPRDLPARYLVVHPGATVPARTWAPDRFAALVAALGLRGRAVVVTGSAEERALTAAVAGSTAIDLGGCCSLDALLAVLTGADAVIVGNTGPAHLAAAVGTPVVSLFAPTVPAARWRPYGVPHALLGAQDIGCAGCRARACPVPGHPCLGSVDPEDVVAAVDRLAPVPRRAEAVA
jgi:ADP-heptose:LPS heptosyltransferase